jgi:hypothetical protein
MRERLTRELRHHADALPDETWQEELDRALVRAEQAEAERDALRKKLDDATAYCSGEWPCEASTSAASLERERNDLAEELDALRKERDAPMTRRLSYGRRPRCSCYSPTTRCKAPAVAHLLAPDGTPVPGAWVCWEHGAAVLVLVDQAKLGETWRAVAIDIK